MARPAKPRKRKPAPQRSKLPRYVVKLHDDDFFDEEDAEVLRFDNFDDAIECCADLGIPFFVNAGNKKLVFWFVRVDDEGYPSSLAGWRYPALLMLPRFADIFQQGNRWLN